eukprot:TRINITY_DN43335_c0_g1_i4.p1 TRINITY_DN43335_c0_g1~~TRINITY_DN43335_c0_g1_i4.p1  ORF type:complete len:233 (+),score=12.26 TRINITY_DN43335_c0_g1_i4:205-903(+)
MFTSSCCCAVLKSRNFRYACEALALVAVVLYHLGLLDNLAGSKAAGLLPVQAEAGAGPLRAAGSPDPSTSLLAGAGATFTQPVRADIGSANTDEDAAVDDFSMHQNKTLTSSLEVSFVKQSGHPLTFFANTSEALSLYKGCKRTATPRPGDNLLLPDIVLVGVQKGGTTMASETGQGVLATSRHATFSGTGAPPRSGWASTFGACAFFSRIIPQSMCSLPDLRTSFNTACRF